MEIRTATKDDLPRIMELGEEFGHRMLYQKDPEIIEKCLPRILVAEELIDEGGIGWVKDDNPRITEVVGYYHYIVSDDSGFEEMLRCYRQFPEKLISEAKGYTLFGKSYRDYKVGELCICMQGASHREVFRGFIKYLQERYSEIWCYCSTRSRRPETYKELGFHFNLKEQFGFFNVSKGDYSTYQLGRWRGGFWF